MRRSAKYQVVAAGYIDIDIYVDKILYIKHYKRAMMPD